MRVFMLGLVLAVSLSGCASQHFQYIPMTHDTQQVVFEGNRPLIMQGEPEFTLAMQPTQVLQKDDVPLDFAIVLKNTGSQTINLSASQVSAEINGNSYSVVSPNQLEIAEQAQNEYQTLLTDLIKLVGQTDKAKVSQLALADTQVAPGQTFAAIVRVDSTVEFNNMTPIVLMKVDINNQEMQFAFEQKRL
ncbi:hypothetical protein [Paraferrimonas haliotis]|uniref:Lipoprotein n=1 Tax=Paraferrimonas haliotis TaxID=2013866 RepID=A0AA37WW10_9GAMM|nr:hypothetical protein [Paraferrimonas haliotis]GLS82742.1 hypothetical protein GCM10007894_07190 [Paraferrimonas haliotis]